MFEDEMFQIEQERYEEDDLLAFREHELDEDADAGEFDVEDFEPEDQYLDSYWEDRLLTLYD